MSDKSEVIIFKKDDPEMASAAKSAQESFRWCWYQVASDFNRIVPATAFSNIKAAFSDDFSDPESTVEHMFVDSIYFDGEAIHGILRSSPNWLKSVKDGDEVTVTLDRVGDWVCVVDDLVYGAFSLQVLRSRMSAEERTAHDDAWQLTFPEIGVNHIPQRSSAFEEMISEHLKNALADDQQILTNKDQHQRTALHYEVLYGRLLTTKLLIEHGADTKAECSRGWTPLDYANAVGWNEIAESLKSA